MPAKLKMTEAEKLKGKFVVLWRQETKQPAKVIEVDRSDTERPRIKYELVGGPDKGKKFSSRFDSSQEVDVYDDDSVVLALLQV